MGTAHQNHRKGGGRYAESQTAKNKRQRPLKGGGVLPGGGGAGVFDRAQIQIAGKQEELAQLQAQLEEQTAKNEDLQASLDNDEGVREYAERRARSLGYARPNERVYVDVGGGE